MKRALIKNNVILLLSAFTLFFVVVFLALYYFERNNQEMLMHTLIDEVELSYINYEGDATSFVNDFQSSNHRRITILDANGLVLADTDDDTIGTDKSERPEILDLGHVKVRRSATVDKDLLYIASQLDNGNYLRVALELDSQAIAYTRVVWILLISSFVFVVLYYFGLLQVNKNLLKPWKKVKKGLISLSEGSYDLMSLNSDYPEINELLYEMNNINLITSKNLHVITSYQKQLDGILNELNQGVILFNDKEQVVYYNEDARKMFDMTNESLFQPSYYTIRDTQIRNGITDSLKYKKPLQFNVKHGSMVLDVHVLFIGEHEYSQRNAKVLVLFKDVTSERLIEQMKRDFFSHASHELKSPLTAIKGFAELIEHELIKEEEINQTAKQIVKQTETMTALVEDMLMLSRLENLKETNHESQNLEDILKTVIDQLKTFADDKKIKLILKSAPVQMVSDELDMHKLFKNIIENAIQYSENHKNIEIDLYEDDQNIYFNVKDDGIGIAVEHQNRVFERFYRVDKGRLDKGTGLGLAIVKHIVLKYKGSIDLISGLSKGTHIKITLNKKLK